MKMSERNKLLIELQDDLSIRVAKGVRWLEMGNQINFTNEEVANALKIAALSYPRKE